jgi:hypothetical protein
MTSSEATQRRGVRIPRKLWVLAVIVILIALLVGAQNSTVLFPQMTSYRLVDERTIAVTVGAAPCSWTRVTNVAESGTDVRIRVETLPCPIPLPQTDALDLRELTVSLANDLGNRKVTDAQGHAIPMRPAGS